jgi:hypothetical protein
MSNVIPSSLKKAQVSVKEFSSVFLFFQVATKTQKHQAVTKSQSLGSKALVAIIRINHNYTSSKDR